MVNGIAVVTDQVLAVRFVSASRQIKQMMQFTNETFLVETEEQIFSIIKLGKGK